MRSLLLALALSLALPSLAHASPESDASDRLKLIEAQLASLQAQVAALQPAPQPSPRLTPRYVNAAKALLGYRMAAFGSPIFAYPGYGGGSGGGSVSSANIPDPYTPPDGTWNVTGAITATGRIIGNDVLIGSCGTCVVYGGTGPANGSNGNGKLVLPNASTNELRSAMADGASAEGNRISVHADYTTSGAKIASFGDSAGTSYVEKASIDLNGTFTGAAVRTSGFLDTTGTGSANQNFRDSSNNTMAILVDLGAQGGLAIPYASLTIADNGGGTAATHTALPTGGRVLVTCSDANNCEWTITETSATDAICARIINAGTNTLVMKQAAGQVLFPGAADQTLGQNDEVEVCYSSTLSAWIGTALVNR